jgi:tetratricopeptide (TPR) repeat protein
VSRPSLPQGGANLASRPGAGNRPGADRPSFANRPELGNRPGAGIDRPSFGNANRPATLPGNVGRPSIGDRPGAGGNRPSIVDRPGRPGDRPSIGGGTRPGQGGAGERLPGIDRPGRPGDRDRPTIGGRDGRDRSRDGNRINIGNDINLGGGNVVGNRPNWDRPDWNNPGWGWGGGSWAGNWHDHCIRPHYGWYNGCWNGGYWGSNWYRPLAWTAVGWGIGSLTSGWGYGTAYYNPYYVSSASAPYNYSQPVVVNNYVSEDAEGGAAEAPPETPATEQATKLFDAGLAQFKSGDYRGALAKFDAALQKLPGDPVVHEVRALALFALGDYKAAAAALNSFLSSAPGMDWTTMSGLYGNVDDYQAQLNKLDAYAQAHPTDPASHFVLAYHALVLGDKDRAIGALEVVVKNQPKDATARRMLAALSPPEVPAATSQPAAGTEPEIDLVGNWRARAGDTSIDLTIGEDAQFTWKAQQVGKPPVALEGRLAAAGDQLVLESAAQGSMAGTATPLSPDKWRFALSGAPPDDPGLSFARVK